MILSCSSALSNSGFRVPLAFAIASGNPHAIEKLHTEPKRRTAKVNCVEL